MGGENNWNLVWDRFVAATGVSFIVEDNEPTA